MTHDYYGTKRVTAWPQQKTPGHPGDEMDPVDGYAVKYSDGYISWSPKDVFEAAYQPITAMSFGHALLALEAGHRVARAGWNGKGMFLVYVPGTPGVEFKDGSPYRNAGIVMTDINPHIDMFTADACFQPGWLASQTDMLAKDWTIVG